MGADIHGPFIERVEFPDSKDHPWWSVAELDGDRNYALFGLMADVRGWSSAVVPARRGWPTNPSWQAQKHAKDGLGDCHSHSWLTLDEARMVKAAYVDYCRDEWPDGATLPTFIDYAIAIMEVAETPGHPTRMLFCFDN
jgi:hypothetical protein